MKKLISKLFILCIIALIAYFFYQSLYKVKSGNVAYLKNDAVQVTLFSGWHFYPASVFAKKVVYCTFPETSSFCAKIMSSLPALEMLEDISLKGSCVVDVSYSINAKTFRFAETNNLDNYVKEKFIDVLNLNLQACFIKAFYVGYLPNELMDNWQNVSLTLLEKAKKTLESFGIKIKSATFGELCLPSVNRYNDALLSANAFTKSMVQQAMQTNFLKFESLKQRQQLDRLKSELEIISTCIKQNPAMLQFFSTGTYSFYKNDKNEKNDKNFGIKPDFSQFKPKDNLENERKDIDNFTR